MGNFTLKGAYLALGIYNGDLLADEDVGVVYYKERPHKVEYSTDALQFIAEARRSRFLRFLATIREHLNEKNIAILAKKTFPASPEPENSGEVSDATGLVVKMTEAPIEPEHVDEGSIGAKSADDRSGSEEGSQDRVCESPESEMDVDASGEHYPTSSAGEESEDDDTIAFDERDGIWRCVSCFWEVEAENETDGYCRCLTDKGQSYFIDLSGYHDYEPADSCSSEDDSTDSESNSDDERFIDDAADITIEPVNLTALYKAPYISNILKATANAKDAKITKDKENLDSTASSDDIEIIDAPKANAPPVFPNNIIDCESMET